jgi:hypothetical protein
MASKVQIKRSSVPSKVPTTADLDLGELAINTYDGKVFLKKSVAGTESIVDLTSAGPSGQYIISSQQIFTANANQTTFSVNYTVGYVDVHLNGIKLVSGQDFTATNGSSVVLATAATAGDIVDITAGNTFSAGAGSANGIMPVELGGTASSTAAGARTNLGLGNVENKSSATIRSELTSTNVTTALGFTPYNSANPSGYISGNQTITFSGDATGSGTTSVALTLANSGVIAGTYGNANSIPQLTVDAKGRVTAVTNVGVNIPSGSLTFTGDVTGTGSTGSSTALTLANSGVTAGTFTKVTVDAKGRVTTGTTLASADLPTYTGTITSSQVTTALGFTPYNATNPSGYISGNQTITFTGDATGTGATSVALTLANSGVTAGTFTKVTVDAKGRVTTGATLSASDIPNLDASKITSGVIDAARLPSYVDDVLEFANLAGFPATGETGKIYVALDTNKAYRWSGTVYVYITSGAVDSVAGKTGVVTLVKGDVGLGSVDNTADVSKNVLSATKWTTARTETLSGDVSGSASVDGSANWTITTTLANSGVTAGTYTKVTVDAKGRVTTGTTLSSADLPTYTGTINSSQVTTALGFTPYNSTNPNGYITSSALSSYLPLSGGTLTGNRTIQFSTSDGAIFIRGDAGGWATGMYFVGSDNQTKGGFGGLGGGTTLSNLWAGPAYNNTWMTWSSSAVNANVALQQGGNQVLHAGNYTSYALPLTGGSLSGTLTAPTVTASSRINYGNHRDYYIGSLYANATQARRYEIARVYIDFNDWHSAGTIRVELHNKYYVGGDRQVYNISYDYNNVNCDLVESIGPRGRGARVVCSSPVQVSGDSYYISVYCDVIYYNGYDVYLSTSWPEVTTHAAHAGNILVYQNPSGSNISDFSMVENVVMRANSLTLSGNTVLHSANYSTYALPLSGGTLTGVLNMGGGTQTVTHAGFAGIEYYNAAGTWQGYVGTENNSGNLRYNSRLGTHSWYANSTQIGSWTSTGLNVIGGETRAINFVLPSSYNSTNYNNLISRINFPWYSDYWDIGVRRGGGTDIQSMEWWFNGTSKWMELTRAGTLEVDGNGIRQGNNLARPLAQWSATSATGMVFFELPGTASNYGMVHMVFDIYEYNSNSVSTVIVGGHNWNSYWVNIGANVIGQTDKAVRLGFRGGKYVVCFGTASSSWTYGTVMLRKIHNAGFYDNIMDMGAQFVANITTSESLSWDSGDLRALRTPAGFNAGGAITQAGNQVLHAGNVSSYALPTGGGTLTGGLHVGSAIGSRGRALTVNGSTNSSPIVAKSSDYATVFGILPHSSSWTYLSTGVYYDNGSWVHASASASNALIGISGDSGVMWYASNNSSASWNVATRSLWDNAGTWVAPLNAQSGAQVTGNTIVHAGNVSNYAVTSVNGQVGAVTVAAGDGGALFSAFE